MLSDSLRLYEQARQAVDAGRFAEAKDTIDEALAVDATDAPIRELYAGLHLAAAVKAGARARELRRKSIADRGIGYDEEFSDTEETRRAFQDAIDEFDRVLHVDPGNEKALMLKAAALHRFDRAGKRAEAADAIRRILAANPNNQQAKLALRKIERPCQGCSDSGFCPHCAGRGFRAVFGIQSQCKHCWGQGVCQRCGLL